MLTIITGLTLAGILWLVRSVNELTQSVAVLRSLLVGESGSNGLMGDVRLLREQASELNEKLGKALERIAALETPRERRRST